MIRLNPIAIQSSICNAASDGVSAGCCHAEVRNGGKHSDRLRNDRAGDRRAGAMLRAIGVLLLALGLAISSIFLATRAFNMALAMPSIAALDPALLESLFDFAVFGLLALVAWIALRVEKRKVALGRPLPGLGGIGLVLGIAGVGAALVTLPLRDVSLG